MPEEVKYLISLLSPIIGALAGVFLVPFVESRKLETLKKELIQNLKTEIEDLSFTSKEKALKLYTSRTQLKQYLTGQTSNIVLNGLSEIELYYTHDSLTKAYSHLTIDERRAIKALISNVDMINKNIKAIANDIKNISYWDSAIEHTANIYWLTTKMTSDTIFTYHKDHINDVVTKQTLQCLGIKLI